MAKKRTRREKVKAGQRQRRQLSFSVDFSAVGGIKTGRKAGAKERAEAKFFRSDLTKVAALTMLALALETALWLYLKR